MRNVFKEIDDCDQGIRIYAEGIDISTMEIRISCK